MVVMVVAGKGLPTCMIQMVIPTGVGGCMVTNRRERCIDHARDGPVKRVSRIKIIKHGWCTLAMVPLAMRTMVGVVNVSAGWHLLTSGGRCGMERA